MTIELRRIREDEFPAFRTTLFTAFGDEPDEVDPDGAERLRHLITQGCAFAAFDGSEMVATAGTLDLTIGVPGGGTLAVAGLTTASVRSTHRRRGILRGLVEMHLADARERKLPASGLWASEASIYGRFGYGIATYQDELAFANASSLLPPTGANEPAYHFALVSGDVALELQPAIYARAIADRPGAIHRTPTWWKHARHRDAPFVRHGATRLRHAIARRGGPSGEPVAYVMYRQRSGWKNDLPDGTVLIVELIGIDPAAELAMWGYVTNIDLFPNVTWGRAPVDCPLPWFARDGRRVRRTRTDAMWLRIDDVPAALTARRYRTDGALRIGVEGTTYELVVQGGQATCTVTTAPPALVVSRSTLGSIYLGGTSATQLARAGLIGSLTGGAQDTVGLVDRLFDTPTPPWCSELF